MPRRTLAFFAVAQVSASSGGRSVAIGGVGTAVIAVAGSLAAAVAIVDIVRK